MPAAFRSPDPVLSANVYASGLLDDVLARAIVPFRQSLRDSGLDERCHFWLVRYSRGGEHLKIRVHGRAADRDALRRMLTDHVERYLSHICNLPSASPRVSRTDAPAVDPEDDGVVDGPDRRLVWTTYRRSHVSLGGPPWLASDRFVGHVCECLSRGSELVLTAITGGAANSRAARHKVLIRALIAGLKALGLGEMGLAAEYLKHHRDVLLRFFVGDDADERRALALFESQAGCLVLLDRLRTLAEGVWKREAGKDAAEPWPRALAAFASFTRTFAGRSEYPMPRSTSNVTLPPAFKIFHGLANQLGLGWLDEASVHHLLLGAVAPVPTGLERAQ